MAITQVSLLAGSLVMNLWWIFNEHELMFTFAICCRKPVCHLSVVRNVRPTYSAG